jgi:hypothetical protein
MNTFFKDETFRNDFTFQNSPVNMEPHVKAGAPGSAYEFPIDIDEHYVSDMRDRALVLAEDPLRCQALPHMMSAQWDVLELLMTSMAEA